MAGDDGLAIDAPQNALTPNLLERLKANKREIIRLFDKLGPCPDCESHRIEIPTSDGYLNLECPACDRCFGCRPATAEIAEKLARVELGEGQRTLSLVAQLADERAVIRRQPENAQLPAGLPEAAADDLEDGCLHIHPQTERSVRRLPVASSTQIGPSMRPLRLAKRRCLLPASWGLESRTGRRQYDRHDPRS